MSQKKARAQRKVTPAHPLDIPKDSRQPIKLDRVTAEDGLSLLTATLNRALESTEMQVVMRNILKGRRLVLNSIGKAEPDLPWGWRLQGCNIGDLWLVPLRKDDELKDDGAPTPTNFHPDDTTPSTHDEPPKTNGHAEKAKVEAAKVVAKDSA